MMLILILLILVGLILIVGGDVGEADDVDTDTADTGGLILMVAGDIGDAEQ